MSIGYTLTESEYTQVQGQFYTPYEFFNCVQDIDGTWFLFLSDQDKPEVEASEYAWVLDLPQAEYIPPIPPPFPPLEN
jgi:hypothetical protein